MYTQEDLTRINTAINEFIAGDRVGEVRTASTTMKYADVSLTDLTAERDRINRALRPRRQRFRQIVTSKGL